MAMNSSPSRCDELPADIFAKAGVAKFGVADVAPVDDEAVGWMARWLSEGRNADMDYMARYSDVRANPELLLPDAKSIISCAFPYFTPRQRNSPSPHIAMYALGLDYHTVIRRRLTHVARYIEETFGGATRICVDTAPIRERYWAVKAGLGFIGLNNQLIIPGAGAYFFLAEILTTHRFTPSAPCTLSCGECRRCLKACPGKALDENGAVDARKCLSYLSIEHRGELPPDFGRHNKLYGCDDCLSVCPHNAMPMPSDIAEFSPAESVLSLSLDDVMSLSPEGFSALFSKSAIKRTKLSGLQRNAAAIKNAATNN